MTADKDFANTLDFALEHLHLHRNTEHYGQPGPLGTCLTCRNLEERVKMYHKEEHPGSVPQSVVPGREDEVRYF